MSIVEIWDVGLKAVVERTQPSLVTKPQVPDGARPKAHDPSAAGVHGDRVAPCDQQFAALRDSEGGPPAPLLADKALHEAEIWLDCQVHVVDHVINAAVPDRLPLHSHQRESVLQAPCDLGQAVGLQLRDADEEIASIEDLGHLQVLQDSATGNGAAPPSSFGEVVKLGSPLARHSLDS